MVSVRQELTVSVYKDYLLMSKLMMSQVVHWHLLRTLTKVNLSTERVNARRQMEKLRLPAVKLYNYRYSNQTKTALGNRGMKISMSL